ncbi:MULTISPECIES: 50S ribosomal protein L22 [Spirosomataceae]|jgi:large subunit ribosomal protein L22|uniref:Large ribosomal subunit protein uL22 n=1 Tax=Fibrivirga algicola TaxID=2950420 RepID=A0ABX0QFW1_9BACT|nr:50S ribosomal protein L22 [Fibrivirga algicola]ARK10882.1 50S ribosomal protein L22 [Fibrella sp. ES10-3-2-2]NID09872.1 50S ribosomal protein L22 [Fibrivirga algicola]
MEAIAKLKNVPTSPRKMRLIVDLIRGQRVSRALGILRFQPQAAAVTLQKVLLSAVANWQVKYEGERIEDADLYIKTIFVDGGTMLKRLRPAPQGRGHRIRKRSNHITLVIDSAAPALPTIETAPETSENA